MLSAVKSINLVISFLLELALVAAVAFWGFTVPLPLVGRVLLGLGSAAVVVAGWALFMAPRARRRVPEPARTVVALALFLTASALLITGGRATTGLVFAAVAVLNAVGLYALRRHWSPLDGESKSRAS